MIDNDGLSMGEGYVRLLLRHRIVRPRCCFGTKEIIQVAGFQIQPLLDSFLGRRPVLRNVFLGASGALFRSLSSPSRFSVIFCRVVTMLKASVLQRGIDEHSAAHGAGALRQLSHRVDNKGSHIIAASILPVPSSELRSAGRPLTTRTEGRCPQMSGFENSWKC